MMKLSDFGREYLLLGLRISRYVEDKAEEELIKSTDKYAEAYFGPLELKQLVKGEGVKSPKQLLSTCISLQNHLKDQGFQEERVKFIGKMLDAMRTRLELDLGVEIPYLEQVKRLYDISPNLIDDSLFFKVKEELDELLEGTGLLLERTQEIVDKHTLPLDKIESTYNTALQLVRDKTYELFPDLLPASERVSIEIVKDKPWSAYNWYEGNYHSRIEINTDLPVTWTSVLGLSAHEGYPGHHTEHAIKNYLLYNQDNRFEHSIVLIQTPEAVICEGIARNALDVLFSTSEGWELSLDHLCPDKEEEDIEFLIKRSKLYRLLRGFSGNIAIHKYVDYWLDDELMEYMLQFGFWSEEWCKHTLSFIKDSLWSTFIFTYSEGESLIKAKYGDRPSPKNFSTLLTRPILPSDLI
jgi:hypothetical protein